MALIQLISFDREVFFLKHTPEQEESTRGEADSTGRISAVTWRQGKRGEGGRSLQCAASLKLKKVFVSRVLVQCEVHHLGGGHPVGLRGNSSPELGLVCADELLHGALLPAGQALYHASTRVGTPGSTNKRRLQIF